ncbi:MAG: hypothetical protein H6934_13825 [Burkholderiaceae bacterium]|nr:hypothetical protein [Burkholderiaceae bacterium]
MNSKILVATAIASAMLWSHTAQAKGKFRFGTDEQVRTLSERVIAGPNGGKFRIGHLVTVRHFGLPYSISSKGYVLTPVGDASKYIPLYEDNRLTRLQARGIVPKSLPAARLSSLDYLWGHALWVALAGLIGWIGFQVRRERRQASRPGSVTS